MKKVNYTILTCCMFLTAILTGCSEKNDSPEVIALTQSALDNVSTKVGDFTGSSFAHNGSTVSGDSTTRSVFTSLANLNGDLPVGTIVSKITYLNNAAGEKTDEIKVTFAMVKRESGYFPDGGDWEYVVMPYSDEVDYATHPYGVLPEAESATRGKLISCNDCHKDAGGSDFLWVND